MVVKVGFSVTFIIFNRPDTTQKVFDAIRRAKPSKLFIIADGPRKNKIGEVEKCIEVRKIIDGIDWECEVYKNYAETNLGCKERFSSGLNWVFSQVEESIILEDDCLPEPTFFDFCNELLEKYRYDNRVMAISGNNFQSGIKRSKYSYYFSCFPHSWGWATWKRAWHYFDVDISLYPTIKDSSWLKNILKYRSSRLYWNSRFKFAQSKANSSVWDFQWVFANWTQNGLTITPNVNLVSNIGFGEGATHTKLRNFLSEFPTEAQAFPLQHPPYVIRDIDADLFSENKFYKNLSNIKLTRITKNAFFILFNKILGTGAV